MGSKWLWHSLLLIPLSFSPLLADDLQPVTLEDFTPGLQTTKDPGKIESGAAQDLKNVDVWTGAVKKRRGSTLQNSTDLGGYASQSTRLIHEFPDLSGNYWMISLSSATLFKSQDSGVTWSVLTSTHGFKMTSVVNSANAYGVVYIVDGSTNAISFDGTVVSVSTPFPKGNLIVFWSERLWIANVVGDNSTLYASRLSDPKDFTDDGIDDGDSFAEPVGKNDGYPIRAMVPYGNAMVVFKDFSMYLVSPFPDGLNFTIDEVSRTIGTKHPGSVQVVNNTLIFLGPDSYYSYDGANLFRISDDIRPTVKSIRQLNSAARSYTASLQSEFSAGTNNQTSPNITVNSVLLSTFTGTDTTDANFLSGVTTTTVIITRDRVHMSTNNVNVPEGGFEVDVSSGSTPGWTMTNFAADPISCAGAQQEGSCNLDMESGACGNIIFELLDVGGAVELSSTIAVPNETTYSQYSVNTSSVVGKWVRVRIRHSVIDDQVKSSSAFLASGGTMTFWMDPNGISGNLCNINLDNIQFGRSTVYNSVFESKSFDTTFSSTVFTPSSAAYTTYNHSVAFQTRSSTNGSNWNDYADWLPGNSPASAARRYIQYRITMTTGSSTSGAGQPFVDGVTLNGRAITGRFLSFVNIGANINTWGEFTANVVTSGTVTHELYTDTDTASGINVDVLSSFTSSQTITRNSIPSISTAIAAYIATTFTITSDQMPQLDDFTLSWYEGSSTFPIVSVGFENEYLCGVSVDSTTLNDTILVYDRNKRWTKYKNLNAYSMGMYRQKPYYGDSARGRVYRFQVDDELNDNNANIDSYWISKEFDFGFSITDKTMQRYYVSGNYESGSDAVFSYGVNRGNLTSETLDLGSVSGLFRKSIAPSVLGYQRGVSHRFKIGDSDAGDTFNLLSVTMVPRLETAP